MADEILFALSLTIDNVLDYADTTVDEMYMLDVNPNPFIERHLSNAADRGDAAANVNGDIVVKKM